MTDDTDAEYLAAAQRLLKKRDAENERLRGTLRKIAMQMKSDELGDDDGDDFEGAYDAMIEEARDAIADEQIADDK